MKFEFFKMEETNSAHLKEFFKDAKLQIFALEQSNKIGKINKNVKIF